MTCNRGKKLGLDVDGVVLNLMGGFRQFMWDHHKVELDLTQMTTHEMSRCPSLKELHERLDLKKQLADFLAIPDVYQRYVDPIPGAIKALKELRKMADVAWITATLKSSPQSYASKFLALQQHFGEIPMIACPSELKSWFHMRWAVDDRADICAQYEADGTRGLIFRQPWNEAPDGTKTYLWDEIVVLIDDEASRWP